MKSVSVFSFPCLFMVPSESCAHIFFTAPEGFGDSGDRKEMLPEEEASSYVSLHRQNCQPGSDVIAPVAAGSRKELV